MRVLCVGLMVCDILIKPVSAECFKSDTSTADIIKLTGGGDAYNVAINLAALEIDTSLVSRTGDDDLGTLLINRAKLAGVDISSMIVCDVPTSSSAVLIQGNGQRNFLSFKGACHALREEDISDSLLSKHDFLYVGSAFDLPELDGRGMAALYERAGKAGLKTALDTTANIGLPQFEILRPVLRHINLFLPSLREALSLSGMKTPEEAADFFHENGSEVVVIKLGKDGCLVSTPGSHLKVPAFAAEAVDTTGAGDAFVSGFIAAYCRGMSLKGCAIIGNAAGAVCVGKMGASGTLESFEQLSRYVYNK